MFKTYITMAKKHFSNKISIQHNLIILSSSDGHVL